MDRGQDYQTPSLHLNYNTLLPNELRVWTTGEKERWSYDDIAALRDYLDGVLAEMRTHTRDGIGWMGTSGTEMAGHIADARLQTTHEEQDHEHHKQDTHDA